MKGSVGRAFAKARRYKEDDVYREKTRNIAREYRKKNKEKIRLGWEKWNKKLNEFTNKKCKKCDKLLDFRTKGDYCHKHWREGK